MVSTSEMTCETLVDLYRLWEGGCITVWLDGGRGVDALLGYQSRSHKDADIVLAVEDVPKLQSILGKEGFYVKEGQPPHSFVLAKDTGFKVDVHAVKFDQNRDGLYRMQNGEDWAFPAEGFNESGSVGGVFVRCLSVEIQVLYHAHGYEPSEKDINDMNLLSNRFRVELPEHLKS